MQLVTGTHFEEPVVNSSNVSDQKSSRVSGFNAYQHTVTSNRKSKKGDEAPSPIRTRTQKSADVNKFNKKSLAELKNFANPPVGIMDLVNCII